VLAPQTGLHANGFGTELMTEASRMYGYRGDAYAPTSGMWLSDTGIALENGGHFQRFIPRTIGTVKIERPGRQTLTVRARSKRGPAVMDLRRVVLRPVP